MNKDTIPEDFTLSLATVDAIVVILFAINMLMITRSFNNILFLVGAVICSVSGLIKVLWKYVVVLKQKNVWWMFMQMRILMPIGFACMMIPLFNKAVLNMIIFSLTTIPSNLFFITHILLMGLMMILAFKLDSSDVKSNWLEQSVNVLAQLSFLIGLLLL